jgi:hypothetical protein
LTSLGVCQKSTTTTTTTTTTATTEWWSSVYRYRRNWCSKQECLRPLDEQRWFTERSSFTRVWPYVTSKKDPARVETMNRETVWKSHCTLNRFTIPACMMIATELNSVTTMHGAPTNHCSYSPS